MKTSVLLLVSVFIVFGMPYLSSATADIFGYFLSGDEVETREEEDSEITHCECKSERCMCCVDFNLTYIDLGGPGCVDMKYISQESGVNLSVSYGESILQSQQVKSPSPESTCVALLTSIAEICARFPSLEKHKAGLRGCLVLEPKLLKAVTATFKIGCFTMGPEGMELEHQNSTISDIKKGPTTVTTQNKNETDPSEDILSLVNKTAQQSIAYISDLFGLNFEENNENDADKSDESSTIENSNIKDERKR